jgi:hypothetical protein
MSATAAVAAQSPRLRWIADVLSVVAWCLLLGAFLFEHHTRVTVVLVAGIPGLGSQVCGVIATRRTSRGRSLSFSDLPWVLGVVPALPLLLIAIAAPFAGGL